VNHASMKPPSNTRRVMLRDVPNGTIVWHKGFWGVVCVRGLGRVVSFLDRWDAPAITLESSEQVSVPYPHRKT